MEKQMLPYEVGRALGLDRRDMPIRKMPQCWNLAKAVLKILYCHLYPDPPTSYYRDSYIEIKPSHARHVVSRGFDVVLNKTLTVVFRLRADPGAIRYDSEAMEFVFDIEKCRVYVCRLPGAWAEYVSQLGDMFGEAVLFQEKVHRERVKRMAE